MSKDYEEGEIGAKAGTAIGAVAGAKVGAPHIGAMAGREAGRRAEPVAREYGDKGVQRARKAVGEGRAKLNKRMGNPISYKQYRKIVSDASHYMAQNGIGAQRLVNRIVDDLPYEAKLEVLYHSKNKPMEEFTDFICRKGLTWNDILHEATVDAMIIDIDEYCMANFNTIF